VSEWANSDDSKFYLQAKESSGGGSNGGGGQNGNHEDRSKMTPDQMMNAGRT